MFLRSLIAALLLSTCWTPASAAAGPGVLEDERQIVKFHQGSLTELTSKTLSHSYLTGSTPEHLWIIELLDGTILTPRQARRSGATTLKHATTMQWSELGVASAPDLEVHASIQLDGLSEESIWRIRLTGLADTAVRAVHFPRFTGLAPKEGESIAVPEWMGKVADQPRQVFHGEDGSPRRREWEYPGLVSMQCIAWYTGAGPGLMLSTNDTAFQRKQFAVFGDGHGGIGMEVVHLPPVGGPTSDTYAPPYETLLTTFNGSWFAAAKGYARWARTQPWALNSRLKQNKTPEWARNTGIWVWNRGRSPGVLPPALLLQEESRLPVSVFWHWWHGCAYDAGFPEYLPPREGERSFVNALAEAKDEGIHALVYMNQRLWGMTAPSWTAEQAERFAVKTPNGSVTPEVYNVFMKVPCASMCMGTPFWRNKYAGLAVQAFKLGVGGIYMDQACSSLSCYDPSHGHPIGGGSYWMEGFRNLEGMIRDQCGDDPPVTLAGEGCGEAWLPHLDLMLSLQVSRERYHPSDGWEPIPFFHAVYHDHVLLYGNYSSLTHPPYDDLWPAEFAPKEPLALLDRKFTIQFRAEQARAFVWGQQPSIANFTPRLLDERREEMDFFIQLAQIRDKSRDFLQHGVMLEPLDIEAHEAEVPVSRLSIYAGQLDRVNETVGKLPLIYSGIWRAPDGRLGIALVNTSDSPQTVSLALDSNRYPIAETGTIHRLDAKGRETLMVYSSGKVSTEIPIPGANACLVEIIPAR